MSVACCLWFVVKKYTEIKSHSLKKYKIPITRGFNPQSKTYKSKA